MHWFFIAIIVVCLFPMSVLAQVQAYIVGRTQAEILLELPWNYETSGGWEFNHYVLTESENVTEGFLGLGTGIGIVGDDMELEVGPLWHADEGELAVSAALFILMHDKVRLDFHGHASLEESHGVAALGYVFTDWFFAGLVAEVSRNPEAILSLGGAYLAGVYHHHSRVKFSMLFGTFASGYEIPEDKRFRIAYIVPTLTLEFHFHL